MRRLHYSYVGASSACRCVEETALDENMLTRILSEPKNALLKQYRELLAMDEVDLISVSYTHLDVYKRQSVDRRLQTQ